MDQNIGPVSPNPHEQAQGAAGAPVDLPPADPVIAQGALPDELASPEELARRAIEAPPPRRTMADVIGDRKVGVFYLGDETPIAVRLAMILPSFGQVDLADQDTLQKIIEAVYLDLIQSGDPIKVRRQSKDEIRLIESIAKRDMSKYRPNPQTGKAEAPIDQDDLNCLYIANGILEPEVPVAVDIPAHLEGDERRKAELRAKADWIKAELTWAEQNELLRLCRDMDQFNLSRIREKVKN